MRGLQIVNDDIVLVNGDFQMLEDDVLVAVERLLTTNLTEFFLDLDMGLEYDVIQRKNYNADEIKQAISDCVMQEERVKSVSDINIEVVGRKAPISFKFATEKETMESEVVI